jgi:uncharacterized protein (TIGR03435 family)
MRLRLASAVMLSCGGMLRGQPSNQQSAFEAVSIRPSPPLSHSQLSVFSGGPGSAEPEQLTIRNYSVRNLIRKAYGVAAAYEISGLDKIPLADEVPVPWIDFDNFDITAKVPLDVTQEDFRLMLRNMLADRFGLKVHFEWRAMPSYNLVVAKPGRLIKGTSGLTPASANPDHDEDRPKKPFTQPALGPPFEIDKNGFPILPMDGMITGAGNGHHRQNFRTATMEELAAWLGGLPAIKRPVIDKTDLKGKFEFSLYWTQEDISWTNGIQNPPPNEPIGGPSVFEALEKQLGLRLEPSRSQIHVLVIEHIDRKPTEN